MGNRAETADDLHALLKAAAAGDALAQAKFADLHYASCRPTPEIAIATAITWLRMASINGHAPSDRRLAQMLAIQAELHLRACRRPDAVNDVAEAAAIFSALAARGDAAADEELARMLKGANALGLAGEVAAVAKQIEAEMDERGRG